MLLRCELRRLFKESRNSAGSRALMSMMRALGYQIGRFKVRTLMKDAGLASKQPGAHRYKVAQSERPDIPKLLAREFDVPQPNQVWCSDISYVCAGGRWHYLTAVRHDTNLPRMAYCISCKGSTWRAAPSLIASFGMPKTTQEASSWA